MIAVDGKKLRRSHDQDAGKAAIYMVSAWATQNELVLGQTKVADKSNEITAIPELIKILALERAIITIDAMGCQKKLLRPLSIKGQTMLFRLKIISKIFMKTLPFISWIRLP